MCTRIFVKNIPESYDTAKLRSLFGQKGDVTDATVVMTPDGRSRRFGFVGFRSCEEASSARKYFDKMFLGTARISCEMAKTSKDDGLPRPWSKYSAGSSRHSSNEVPSVVSSEHLDTVDQDRVGQGSRLFVRNLAFSVTEDDLRALFEPFGAVSEVHVPRDRDSGRSVGFGYVSFEEESSATAAVEALDRSVVQGRLLHVLFSRERRERSDAPQKSGAGTSFRLERQDRLADRSRQSASWNTLFLRSDTTLNAIAARLGIEKKDIVDPESDDLAVRVALSETRIIEETKEFLRKEGVALEPLLAMTDRHRSGELLRSNTLILVKNICFDATKDELFSLFSKYGSVSRIVMAPSNTIALVEFLDAQEAKSAFRSLSYAKFKDGVPLFLEWAPVGMLGSEERDEKSKLAGDALRSEESGSRGVAERVKETRLLTVFVKNLNFDTSEAVLRAAFEQAGSVRSVSIPRKRGGKGPDALLSMGFGFVEFEDEVGVSEATKKLQGVVVDGHRLALKVSDRGSNVTVAGSKAAVPKSSKVVVKNLPFQAKKRELRELFSAFGTLKSVRIPKRFDGTSRGFGFIEFLTADDAAAAIEGLGATHLFGRHLVVQFADDSESLEDARQRHARRHDADATRPSKRQRAAEPPEDQGDLVVET